MISCIRQIGYYLCNPCILLRYWTSIKVEIKEIKDISWYIFISITVVVNYEKLESWLQMLSFILSRGAKRGIIKYVSHYRVLSREGRIIQNMQVLHTHSAHICCVVESYCKWPMGSCEGPQEAINKSELVEKMESLTCFLQNGRIRLSLTYCFPFLTFWYVSCDDDSKTSALEGLQKGNL